MLETCRGLDSIEEPLGANDRGKLGAEDLERHLVLMLEVVREVHDGHAADAEFAVDALAAGEGGVKAIGLCGHERMDRKSPRQR